MLSITETITLIMIPGWHKSSVAYTSGGHRRYNQPFTPTNYGPEYVQGDVVGVGYRPRTGTVFFTRNGKKLEDVTHGLKSQNFFPTVGANGPCTVHVNFGQSGFVFIEANVKKWGLAPMTGSLAPPPPYGSEQGSILLEAGGEAIQPNTSGFPGARHGRTRSRFGPILGGPMSPGPVRSPTDISLAQLVHIPSNEDVGEGTSRNTGEALPPQGLGLQEPQDSLRHDSNASNEFSVPPPEYTSPNHSPNSEPADESTSELRTVSPRPPVPSYDVAMGQAQGSLPYESDQASSSSSGQDPEEASDAEASSGSEEGSRSSVDS